MTNFPAVIVCGKSYVALRLTFDLCLSSSKAAAMASSVFSLSASSSSVWVF